MPTVETEHALAFPNITEIPTRAADLSVSSVRTALEIRLVSDRNAKTLALELADKMQDVRSLITCQCAAATKALKEIHL
jgi:acetolactate synthase regulatory subunit